MPHGAPPQRGDDNFASILRARYYVARRRLQARRFYYVAEQKRRGPRYACEMPISVCAGAFREDTRLHNISHQGMCLGLELPVPDNSVLQMQFIWATTKLCTAHGHFVWRSDHAAGVFLTESSDEYADFINLLAAMPETARAEYWAQVIAPEVRILGTTSGTT